VKKYFFLEWSFHASSKKVIHHDQKAISESGYFNGDTVLKKKNSGKYKITIKKLPFFAIDDPFLGFQIGRK